MTGAELITAERQRQINVEGWTPEHDARHDGQELVAAAVAYASVGDYHHGWVPDFWPWDDAAWKPSDDAVRNLVRAGALIAAEIDRLQAQR